MFQNCEDEGAHTVVIDLDTDNTLLEISNIGGNSFSLEGYDSLLYPGLSSKVSSGFIGNKGLGFRSIVNWANEINIISNGFRVSFKDSNKKNILLEILGYSEEDLDIIREKRRLKPTVYPIPLLNCGIIENLDQDHPYTTTISVCYDKSFEEDILGQIENISSMTLLFLKNINKVIIRVNGEEKIIEVRRSQENDLKVIYHDNEKYIVIEDEGIIDEEILGEYEGLDAKRYSVKIAFNFSLSLVDNVLYNYFRTQIPFELPFVAHASLELDQNRNHSTESPINDFVFEKLFKLHLKLIEILKFNNKSSWLPYRTIATETYKVYKYYEELINDDFENLEVYPTFSGIYQSKNNTYRLKNDISEFIQKKNLYCNVLDNIAIPCDEDLKALNYINETSDLDKKLEEIGQQITSYRIRAQYISLLIRNYGKQKFSVLLDADNNVIDKDDFVYTSKTNDNINLKVPYYSHIKFIHPNLYNVLIEALELNDEINKSRALADELAYISNVHSFEPQVVLKKIISETNIILEDNHKEKKKIIKEFYSVLFHNYCLKDENPELEYNSIIPCLNANNEIVDIKKLVLSKEFETRQKFTQLFGELYGEEDILANIDNLGLVGDINKIEAFLLWLGANKNLILNLISSNVSSDYRLYLCEQCQGTFQFTYEVFNIKSFNDLLQNITISKLIHCLYLDETINKIFNGFQVTKYYRETLDYKNNRAVNVYSFWNYIYFQINKKYNISNYLITNKRDEEWFNPFVVDYDYLLDNVNLDRKKVENILKFFGAKDNFNDLSVDYLTIKTNELAERDNPKGAQLFYKKLVGHYKENGKKIKNIKLYARKVGDIVVEYSRDIYYSDRIQLPDNLTNDFPIFYYPARSGGMTAIEFFGLKDLNDLDLAIEKVEENYDIYEEFSSYIKSIKPFILAYRLDKISSSKVKEAQALLLNKLKIIPCSELECSLNNNLFGIEDLNYIHSDDIYYFKIPKGMSFKDFKTNKIFADNLSELFLKLFDTQEEKRIFESLIRQSYEENLYDIDNVAEGLYEEALILLGEISTRLSIWKSISKILLIDFDNVNESNLDDWICQEFPELEGIELFNSTQNIEELSKIRNVFETLKINLEQYNDKSEIKISFSNLLIKEINKYWSTKKKEIKNQLWCQLNNLDREKQSNFLSYLKGIENLSFNMLNDTSKTHIDYKEFIIDRLAIEFPEFKFNLEYDSSYDYDSIQLVTDTNFTFEELQMFKTNLAIESLKYFEGNLEYLKEWLVNENKSNVINKPIEIREDQLILSDSLECIEDFIINTSTSTIYSDNISRNEPWLGSLGVELSGQAKKQLGNDVENIVYQYLIKSPNTKDVDHVSKVDEGLHYDIKYIDTNQNMIKYVECKYYNGSSFLMSREEKRFADNHIEQYEIWLVDKNSKIYPIRDIRKLGDLLPSNYKVNIKIKSNDHTI